ncbi:unnamed protein product [Parnassius apollo]|uniref:(apollo) hypothetical protein n=1 Tax=Parnassius apollo TaxID=110799 RepID=A0A8S3X6W0_PARAO|nr:unnamed protein product [Parnassius apollo]
MLKEWGILKQNMHCVVRDGGSKIKRTYYLSEIHNIDWHMVKEDNKRDDTISELLKKCKKIAGHYNHSITAKQELEKFKFDSTKSFKSFARLTDTLEFQLLGICWKNLIASSIHYRFAISSNNKIAQLDADAWIIIQES